MILFLIFENLFAQNSYLCDTIVFSSSNIGLHIYTKNIDSIKFFPDKPGPNPFSPDMTAYSAFIKSFDTTTLEIRLKDINQNCMIIFFWSKIYPGAYRFDWWQYFWYNLPSGVYYLEKMMNNSTEIKKVLLVK